MDHESKNKQLDEESNACSYLDVPDQIYGKEYKFINFPVQSKVQIMNLNNKIKEIAKIDEIVNKVGTFK